MIAFLISLNMYRVDGEVHKLAQKVFILNEHFFVRFILKKPIK